MLPGLSLEELIDELTQRRALRSFLREPHEGVERIPPVANRAGDLGRLLRPADGAQHIATVLRGLWR